LSTCYLFPDEAIALAGNGLDKAGLLGIIAQRLPNLAHGGINSVLGIDEDVSNSRGIRSSLWTRPFLLNSKRDGSSSKSPNL
jgi:hypothetical protein